MKLVEVSWDDAWHSQSDYEMAEAKKLKPHPTKSVGYLIKNTSKVCIIAQSIDKESLSEILVIPAGMVTNVREVR